LEFPAVVANIAFNYYGALRFAAEKGHLDIVKRLFVAMRPADIKTAIEQHPDLAPLYENFKNETGGLFHIMVGTLSGFMKDRGIPSDLGSVILEHIMPTPYLTQPKVDAGFKKARKVANEYLAKFAIADVKMKEASAVSGQKSSEEPTEEPAPKRVRSARMPL
jgi:hypothetical protein